MSWEYVPLMLAAVISIGAFFPLREFSAFSEGRGTLVAGYSLYLGCNLGSCALYLFLNRRRGIPAGD